MEAIGYISGIDNFDRIKIILDSSQIITKKINDCPHKIVEDGILYYLLSYKDEYKTFARENINKKVKIVISTRKYYFNGKKGTSLILKYIELI